MRLLMVAAVACALGFAGAPAVQAGGTPEGQTTPGSLLAVHLFGGDMRPGAPLAAWYHEIGITDVWLYTVKGAFPQDQDPATQRDPGQLEADGILDSYRQNRVRYWWFERPVPDYLYYNESGSPAAPREVIWSSGASTDAAWASVCEAIADVYPRVRAAGFEGIVYDNEAYYSYQGPGKPWLWQGNERQLGPQGNYYLRGRQVGDAIIRAWPGAKVLMVYSFGYDGEYWWYRGFHDAGVDVFLAVEHTYGAGPPHAGDQWYQHWFRGMHLPATVAWKRAIFNFLPDDQHVISGLFPIDFSAGLQNYDLRYFRQQLQEAQGLSAGNRGAIWLWPQGDFSPQSWEAVHYSDGSTAADYLAALRAVSTAQ